MVRGGERVTPRYPHHAVLTLLLQKRQYDACRLAAEEMIGALMAGQSDGDQAATESSDGRSPLKDRDRELACLHLIWCMALFSLNKYSDAAEKADLAAFLASLVKDEELRAEALFRAGVCYGAAADYQRATQRLTDCIADGTDTFRGDAFYNRGMVYQSMGAFQYAVPEYEAAIAWGSDRKPDLVRRSSINLAWVLILCREFSRAETLLEQLETAQGAVEDRTLQMQLNHDRLHMSYLQGNGLDAIKRAVAGLGEAGKEYTHVRAHIILTLIGLASEQHLTNEAFIFGILSKRLAGQAHRQDLDDEAGRQLRDLECADGTEYLSQTLHQLRQVLRGSTTRRRAFRGGNQAGGVG